MAANNRDPIIVDALRRFPNLGNRTIARYIIDTVGDKYNNDLEKVRSKIRQLRGANGSEARIKSQNSQEFWGQGKAEMPVCLLYTSPSPRDRTRSRMPSSA